MALRPNALPSGASTIGTALGAFEPADNININLEVQAVNSPLHVKAHVTDEGEALNELSWSVHSKHPLHTHDELLERHERAVRKILHENDFQKDTHQETAALRILNRQRPELNLFRQVHQSASTHQSGGGHQAVITVQRFGRYTVSHGRERASLRRQVSPDKCFQQGSGEKRIPCSDACFWGSGFFSPR